MSKKNRQQIVDLRLLSILRKEKGYTISDLSILSGIEENRLKSIEQGFKNVSVVDLLSIVKPLGVNLKLSVINNCFSFDREFIINKVNHA